MKTKNITITICLFISFIVLTGLLTFVNVKNVAITNTDIGLSFINKISLKLNYNELLDKISDIFLIISIALIALIAFLGVTQLIKRKNLFKVDKQILNFGICLLIMAFLWILFEKVVINYRPILINGEKEAAYPSTHIMIVTFVTLAASYLISYYLKNKINNKLIYSVSILIIIATFTFRFISKMHWLTDCIGGVLLGLILYYIFVCLNEIKK